ncbi:toll/interleukin-1 receptor domain-containing protein [Flavobacteriaceae bacterium TP-CH-4]|uniref:Toll/interleukin-1 receptor domain-containing protein n=1 Tax=Pelagihabitans pacificus TaxID=2696054 RepID=A0A967EE40_9FLAO|nr:toll/interleukin-1 receptor domain-containing protein [Pelagihabitans pacificus]NHF59988.1 toll/interleukin-1 receptor domain-containing protein [Pelagihabitans pacificus]
MIQKVKCVFISYQNKDKSDAKKVADYLIGAGIDVYFDEYDKDLKLSNQGKHPGNVTDSLCKGINNSSHMLVIVSPTTLISKWVPFEIGFGYDKTDLAVLCLKGIPRGGLPGYIRTAKVIRDIYDLNVKISNIKGVGKETLLENKMLYSHSSIENPLNNVMDKSIIMKY